MGRLVGTDVGCLDGWRVGFEVGNVGCCEGLNVG